MWSWIYRIIAALLAAVGTAMLSVAYEALRDGAHRLLDALGFSFIVSAGVVAVILLACAGMIAMSPASRSPPRG
jgi:hypothetical protein